MELITTLRPEEFVELLRASVDPEGWLIHRDSGHTPVTGRIWSRRFSLRLNRGYRNSYAPVLRGKLVPDPAGSRIRVKVGTHPFATWFTVLWFVFLLAGCIQWMRTRDPAKESDSLGMAAVFTLMCIFGVIVLLVCHRLARGEAAELVRFVVDLIGPGRLLKGPAG